MSRLLIGYPGISAVIAPIRQACKDTEKGFESVGQVPGPGGVCNVPECVREVEVTA